MKYNIITNENEALRAVENDGYALRYVKDQTEAICLKAVESVGDALQYVKDRAVFDKLNKGE